LSSALNAMPTRWSRLPVPLVAIRHDAHWDRIMPPQRLLTAPRGFEVVRLRQLPQAESPAGDTALVDAAA
jgi:hypothetical protein